MKCFYHRDIEAVGICKSCNRGLCGDCAAEIGEGLACKGRCEDTVAKLLSLLWYIMCGLLVGFAIPYLVANQLGFRETATAHFISGLLSLTGGLVGAFLWLRFK